MGREMFVGCGVWLSLMVIPTAFGEQVEGRKTTRAPRIQLQNSVVYGAVTRAVSGAGQRLARPVCQQVFTDFSDQSGEPLLARLEASGRTATQYLVERVQFIDGENAPLCRGGRPTAAFTTPGLDVVHVCPAFADLGGHNPTAAEIVVIHELLHTLGLGENPPSSREISQRVTLRCGGS
jgi:hypothetical protein